MQKPESDPVRKILAFFTLVVLLSFPVVTGLLQCWLAFENATAETREVFSESGIDGLAAYCTLPKPHPLGAWTTCWVGEENGEPVLGLAAYHGEPDETTKRITSVAMKLLAHR